MNEVKYERHSDEKDYIYIKKNEILQDDTVGVDPHFHNAMELKFMISGEYSVCIGGVKKVLKGGEVSFVSPRQIHHSQSVGKSLYYTLVFDARFLYSVIGKGRVLKSFMEKDEYVLKLLLEAFNHASASWEKITNESKIGFVYRVLGILAQFYGSTPENVDKTENMAINIMQYIQNNYYEDLTLETLSKKFGYTKNHFSYLFNKYVGMNLRDYLNRCRMQVVVKMMTDNKDLPLCRIAEKVGYKSWVTFYRAYKKHIETAQK